MRHNSTPFEHVKYEVLPDPGAVAGVNLTAHIVKALPQPLSECEQQDQSEGMGQVSAAIANPARSMC